MTTCVAALPLGSCRTNAIQANPNTHCVHALLSGPYGWGNIYDTNGMLGTRVGPANFFGWTTVCGLYGWYYLEVRNVVGVGTAGTLYNN